MKSLLFILAVSFSTLLSAESYDVVIVGGGPAGLTSGLYTSRLGLKTLVAEGEVPGGQLTTTHLVENFPGFVEGIDGNLLVSNMRNQATKYGAEIKSQTVVSVDFSHYPYEVKLSSGESAKAKSIIIATGSTPRMLGLSSESSLLGLGVSTCAVCDAPLYRGKEVVVVGGGDSAFEEALMLSHFARKVTLLHRSNQFRASPILKDRVKQTKNIEIKTFTTVKEILDVQKGFVDGVVVFNTQTEKEEKIPCDGVFIAIGQNPNTGWLPKEVSLDEKGMIQSAPRGVYAAGDVVDFQYRQAITAAGSGCKAALDVYQFIQHEEKK